MDEQLSQCPTQPTQPTQIISQTQLEPPRPPANMCAASDGHIWRDISCVLCAQCSKKVWGRLRRFFPVPGEPAEIEFDPELDEFTVGRHRECEFVVGDVRASNRHCTFLKGARFTRCLRVSALLRRAVFLQRAKRTAARLFRSRTRRPMAPL